MSYKIDEIDYSKNDEIDINNRLSRLARNKIGETSTPLKELDSEDKATGEKNLSIYGAELVNNLKQINYTFRQLEDYVFVPSKEPTEKALKTLRAKGSKATVEDIRRPPKPDKSIDEGPKFEFDFSSVKEEEKEEGPLQETKEGEIPKENIELVNMLNQNYEWMTDNLRLDFNGNFDSLTDQEFARLLTRINEILLILIPMITNLEEELGIGAFDNGPPILEQLRKYKELIDNLNIRVSIKRDELYPLPLFAPAESVNPVDKKEYENLLKAYTNSTTDLVGKFEDADVEVPPEGITPAFVQENKDKLDAEGLEILDNVKEIGDLLTQVEEKIKPEPQTTSTPPSYEKPKPEPQTTSIFKDPNNPDIEYLKNYTFLDDSKTYTPEQIKNKKKAYDKEYDRIQQLSNEEDDNRRGKITIDPAYKSLVTYQYKLSKEGPKYKTFEKLGKAEETTSTPPEYTYKPININSPEYKQFKSYVDGTSIIQFKIADARQEAKALGFNKEFVDGKSKVELNKLVKNYEASLKTGSGRYRGGVKRAPKTPTTPKTPKLSKKAQLLLAQAQQTSPAQAIPATTSPSTPATPAQSIPVNQIDEEVDGEFDDDNVEREQITNFEIAKGIQEVLTEIKKIGQKSPIPAYQNKIDELMTSLVQFIGRTTVLFISKIKKNLKYLDEDLNKEIYDEITKFKRNLEILRNYKNKSSVLIKQTLYNQVEKETIGLYNIINDGIRNFSKLKSYTSLESLQGGYFIQSDDSFIRQSLTKRYL